MSMGYCCALEMEVRGQLEAVGQDADADADVVSLRGWGCPRARAKVTASCDFLSEMERGRRSCDIVRGSDPWGLSRVPLLCVSAYRRGMITSKQEHEHEQSA
jgi:hypothetical protein